MELRCYRKIMDMKILLKVSGHEDVIERLWTSRYYRKIMNMEILLKDYGHRDDIERLWTWRFYRKILDMKMLSKDYGLLLHGFVTNEVCRNVQQAKWHL
jgi:hypothetical protein